MQLDLTDIGIAYTQAMHTHMQLFVLTSCACTCNGIVFKLQLVGLDRLLVTTCTYISHW